jgi:hypothetical protein
VLVSSNVTSGFFPPFLHSQTLLSLADAFRSLSTSFVTSPGDDDDQDVKTDDDTATAAVSATPTKAILAAITTFRVYFLGTLVSRSSVPSSTDSMEDASNERTTKH